MSGLLDTLPLILTLYRCTELIQKSNRIPIDWTSVIEVFKKAFTAPIDILGKSIGNVINEIKYFLDGIINRLTGIDDQAYKDRRVAEI